jgi:hypothetical protein
MPGFDMSSAEEWKQFKLKNLERFKASTFTFADYAAPSAEWDHDHCEGCRAEFAASHEPEILHSGYFTVVQFGYKTMKEPEMVRQARKSGRKVLAKPDNKRWIWPLCFNEFHVILGLKLKSSTRT